MRVSFMMPPLGRSFEMLGRIVRVRKYQDPDPGSLPIYYIALGFLDISAKDQSQINDFIEKIAQDRNARKLVDSQTASKRKRKEIDGGL